MASNPFSTSHNRIPFEASDTHEATGEASSKHTVSSGEKARCTALNLYGSRDICFNGMDDQEEDDTSSLSPAGIARMDFPRRQAGAMVKYKPMENSNTASSAPGSRASSATPASPTPKRKERPWTNSSPKLASKSCKTSSTKHAHKILPKREAASTPSVKAEDTDGSDDDQPTKQVSPM